MRVDVSNLNAATYFAVVISELGGINKRLIKE